MEVTFLSASGYTDPSKNNGDCILVDNGSELVIYDCGCEEHARRVVEYMDEHAYSKAKLVLSHNDADHFDGIPYLIDQGVLSEVYTLLLLKYKDELLDRVNDKRRTRDSIARRIAEIYDNIYSLSEQVILKDIFTDTLVADGITIPGPDKEYSLDAVAKRIDSRESDDIDKETIVNAVSTQLSIAFGLGKRLLLTGDSSFAAIENSVKSHSAIQLPHHGKLDQAEQIFGCKDNSTIYFVSDNTGATNGGSTKLKAAHPRGHAIFYTLDGDQTCTSSSFRITQPSPGVLLEPGFHIRRVEVHETLEGHVQISAGLVELLLVITQTDSNAITRKNANEHAKKRLVKGISVQFKAIFKAEMQRAICKSFWAVFGLFEGSGAHSTILFKKSLKHL